ncbi:hypothetical protein, partial [Oenococcus oeni]|uniref:hypothetical protein n=1 Tax=Oenococcus oeni TaxID=1247 RepID=UPI000B2B1063
PHINQALSEKTFSKYIRFLFNYTTVIIFLIQSFSKNKEKIRKTIFFIIIRGKEINKNLF